MMNNQYLVRDAFDADYFHLGIVQRQNGGIKTNLISTIHQDNLGLLFNGSFVEDALKLAPGESKPIFLNAIFVERDGYVIDEFRRHGNAASYHYADDTHSGEWQLAAKEVAETYRIYDMHPHLHKLMHEVAKDFLWAQEFKDNRPLT